VAGNIAGTNNSNAVGQPPAASRKSEAVERQDSSGQPQLYVAWSSQARRSGT
jgi:hypothetical protein